MFYVTSAAPRVIAVSVGGNESSVTTLFFVTSDWLQSFHQTPS